MASAANQLESSPLPFDRVSHPATLGAAWVHVRRAAERSTSRAVRAEARRFEDDADGRLDRIAADVRASYTQSHAGAAGATDGDAM